MKRVAIAVSVAVVVLTVSASAQPNNEVDMQYLLKPRIGPEQELVKLENDWASALVKRDVAFLDRILAEDYTGTNPDGIVSTKGDCLALIKSGKEMISSLVADDIRVRIYGDTAVVIGRSTVRETLKGTEGGDQCRWTDFWVKDYAGRWQCVASHSSRIDHK